MWHLKKIQLVLMTFLILTLSGCSQTQDPGDKIKETLVIADQFGLAYAPLEIMKEKHFLESALKTAGRETVEISWLRLGNTTAMRESMLSGNLDIGFVGIPPFLLGVENGMDWKIISGLSESAVSLISKDARISSLKDLTSDHRIILPQPGSIQHILLQMAAKDQLGDPHALDDQLLSMSHPDGVVAFTSGQENLLHYTTPPFIQENLKDDDAFELLDGETSFGESFTFIVGMCRADVYEDTALYNAFVSALTESINYMNTHPQASLEILANAYEYDQESLREQITSGQIQFTTEIKGIERFVQFMNEIGLLSEVYTTDTLIWQ